MSGHAKPDCWRLFDIKAPGKIHQGAHAHGLQVQVAVPTVLAELSLRHKLGRLFEIKKIQQLGWNMSWVPSPPIVLQDTGVDDHVFCEG